MIRTPAHEVPLGGRRKEGWLSGSLLARLFVQGTTCFWQSRNLLLLASSFLYHLFIFDHLLCLSFFFLAFLLLVAECSSKETKIEAEFSRVSAPFPGSVWRIFRACCARLLFACCGFLALGALFVWMGLIILDRACSRPLCSAPLLLAFLFE